MVSSPAVPVYVKAPAAWVELDRLHPVVAEGLAVEDDVARLRPGHPVIDRLGTRR